MTENLQNFYAVTRRALFAAGNIIIRGSKHRKRVTYKGLVSPVTQVDVQAENKIYEILHQAFPTHGFIGEESSASQINTRLQPSSSYHWVVDPLDGTVNFVHGIPQSSVSIAIEKGGEVLVGGVYDPFRKEMFMAVRGRGAHMNGKKIHVSSQNKLLRSLLITGFPYERKKETKNLLTILHTLLNQCMDVRRFGSAAIDLAWVACGRADGYWETKLNSWDIAAGSLLVEEAGGRITDFKNKSLPLYSPEQMLATNGVIHSLMVKILKTHRD